MIEIKQTYRSESLASVGALLIGVGSAAATSGGSEGTHISDVVTVPVETKSTGAGYTVTENTVIEA